jgi:hypothetical protein
VSVPADQPYAWSSAAAARWGGWPEVRADLHSGVWLVAALGFAGIPAGLLWWLLAPRADFRITADGPTVLGHPTEELLVADDTVFVLVLVGVGLVCGAAAWWWRRRRGVTTVLALTVGTTLTGVVAWQLGELLGAGPTEAELAAVGTVVTTSLTLGSLPGIAFAPFAAILAYAVGVLHVADDGLGRPPGAPPPRAEASATDGDAGEERLLVEVPPPGRPDA